MSRITPILQSFCLQQVDFVKTNYTDLSRYPLINTGRYRCALILTVEGDKCYWCKSGNKSCFQTHPGTVLFLPQGQMYEITQTAPMSVTKVIDFALTTDHLPDPFLVETKNTDRLLSLFTEIERTWNRQSAASELACRSLIYEILSVLAEEQETYLPSFRQKKLDSAVNYLLEHYTQPDFRIETLPEISGLSHRYFNRLFSFKYGCSPKEYVTQLRITRAKNLLITEKDSIGSIAESLGYSSVYHFSKIFKKMTGLSPTQYRQRNIL